MLIGQLLGALALTAAIPTRVGSVGTEIPARLSDYPRRPRQKLQWEVAVIGTPITDVDRSIDGTAATLTVLTWLGTMSCAPDPLVTVPTLYCNPVLVRVRQQ